MASSVMSLYASLPLGTNEFRGLRVSRKIGGDGGSAHGLHLSLTVIKFPNTGDYEALSYAWGDPAAEKVPVQVHSESDPSVWATLPITVALQTALQSLSSSDVPVPIFIDQLCINQEDQVEKGSQIKLMQHIYRNATQVLAWLGPPTEAANRYIDFLEEIERRITQLGLDCVWANKEAYIDLFEKRNLFQKGPKFNPRGLEKGDEMVSLIVDSSAAHIDAFDGMADMMGRPWFNRLWVVQEACLNRKLTFIIGDRRVTWLQFRIPQDIFSLLIVYLAHIDRLGHVDMQLTHKIGRLLKLQEPVFLLGNIRHAIKISKYQEFGLLVKLYSGGHTESELKTSFPKDRIFGVLGLAKDDDLAVFIKQSVDYTDSLQLVYTKVTAKQLELGDIDTLLFAQEPKSVADFPSWVPDWSSVIHIPRIRALKFQTTLFSAGGPPGNTKPQVTIVNNGNKLSYAVLEVRGFKAGVITRIGQQTIETEKIDGSAYSTMVWSSVCHFQKEVDAFLDHIEQKPSSEPPNVRSLPSLKACRLATGGLFARPGPAKDELLQTFHADALNLGRLEVLKQRVENWTPDDGEMATPADRQMLDTQLNYRRGKLLAHHNGPHSEEWTDYQDFIKTTCGCHLFMTDSGRVGLCPPYGEVRIGDEVAVLSGLNSPVILRAVEPTDQNSKRHYQYLGEAYCDEIMDGELLGSEDGHPYLII